MSEHFNTEEGFPQTKAEVEALSDDELYDFAALCEVEPAHFDTCLACYAYKIICEREENA